MTVSLTLLLTAGVLIACGIYLILERTLTRILIGVILAGNGVNLLFLVAAGRPGSAPFDGATPASQQSDPLPFALVLTAVVITMGVAGFVAALGHRSWQLFEHDEVPDDVEDRRILERSRRSRAADDEHVETGGDLDADFAADEAVPLAETEAEDDSAYDGSFAPSEEARR